MANPLENTDAIMRFASAKERKIVADLADVLSSLVDDPAVIRDIKSKTGLGQRQAAGGHPHGGIPRRAIGK